MMIKKINLANSKKFLKNYQDEYLDSVKNIIADISYIMTNNLAIYKYENKIKILNKYININILFNNIPDVIRVSGCAIYETNTIKILIKYPYYYGMYNIEAVLSEVMDCIRHEIQHFVQHMTHKFEDTLYYQKDDMFMYYLSPHEVESHIYGFIYSNIFKGCVTNLKYDISNYFKGSYILTPAQKEILYTKYNEIFTQLFRHQSY